MSPAVQIMLNLGFKPDPWQIEVLEGRQGGKSTVVAILALVEALFQPDSQILLLSRSYRHSRELFHTITGFFERLQSPMKKSESADGLVLANGSRMIVLSTPYGKRGFFFDCWARGGDDWKRIEIPADHPIAILLGGPTGRNVIAQGNALGTTGQNRSSPNGAQRIPNEPRNPSRPVGA